MKLSSKKVVLTCTSTSHAVMHESAVSTHPHQHWVLCFLKKTKQIFANLMAKVIFHCLNLITSEVNTFYQSFVINNKKAHSNKQLFLKSDLHPSCCC